MANHKSAEKRIRQTEVRRLRNRYVAKTTRNAVRKLSTKTISIGLFNVGQIGEKECDSQKQSW